MTPQEIRELRLKLGLTQGQLGEKVGSHRNTVSQWELGKQAPGMIAAYRLGQLRKENDAQENSATI